MADPVVLSSRTLYAPPILGIGDDVTYVDHAHLLCDVVDVNMAQGHEANLATGFSVFLRNAFARRHDRNPLSRHNELVIMSKIEGSDLVRIQHEDSHRYNTEIGMPSFSALMANVQPADCAPGAVAKAISIRIAMHEIDDIWGGRLHPKRRERRRTLARQTLTAVGGVIATAAGLPPTVGAAGAGLVMQIVDIFNAANGDDVVISHPLTFEIPPAGQQGQHFPRLGYYVIARKPIPMAQVQFLRTSPPQLLNRRTGELWKHSDYIVVEVTDFAVVDRIVLPEGITAEALAEQIRGHEEVLLNHTPAELVEMITTLVRH